MPSSQSPHGEPGLPILIVRFGSAEEVLRPGDGPVFIGRELPAQIRVGDTHVSRTHARIESTGARWTVVDEASTNGMFLDGNRVSTVSVADGMTLNLGHAEGVAVRFSFIDPDAGTMFATQAMPSRAEHADAAPSTDEPTVRTDAQVDPDIVRAGAAVAARREELGHSLRRLSDDAGIDVAELENFERGRRWPDMGLRERIEHALRWPPGTLTLVAAGGEIPEDDDTETLSDSVQLEVMLDYADIALDGLVARIATLPPVGDPDFGPQAAEQLAQLRRLQTTTADAARNAPALEIMLALSDVRRTYSELMLRAAGAPSATLGQRLYAARHRAQLAADEIAAAAGVDVDAVRAVEAERDVPDEVSAALENVAAALTDH
jgi:transcriptional regulator with XRE-family HTH domain